MRDWGVRRADRVQRPKFIEAWLGEFACHWHGLSESFLPSGLPAPTFTYHAWPHAQVTSQPSIQLSNEFVARLLPTRLTVPWALGLTQPGGMAEPLQFRPTRTHLYRLCSDRRPSSPYHLQHARR